MLKSNIGINWYNTMKRCKIGFYEWNKISRLLSLATEILDIFLIVTGYPIVYYDW